MDYVIVTGAFGGIGRAVVKDLIAEGFGVWAVGRAETICASVDFDNVNIKKYPCDFSDEESIKTMITSIVAETGPIAGVVHCAGTDKLCPIYLNKRKDIESLFNIHVYAAMDLCKYLAKKGNAKEGCGVVLISSMAAHEGAMGHTAYAAAKGAIEGFLPSAAAELAERKIRINEVVLGIVQTKMSNGYISKMDDSQRAAMDNQYPLGIGQAEDVSKMIVFLVSEKASWITGQKYILDGGHSIRKV